MCGQTEKKGNLMEMSTEAYLSLKSVDWGRVREGTSEMSPDGKWLGT